MKVFKIIAVSTLYRSENWVPTHKNLNRIQSKKKDLISVEGCTIFDKKKDTKIL